MREKAGMALNPCFSKCYVTCVVEKIIGKYGLLPEIWILLKDFGGKIKEKNNQWVILMMENPQYILNFVNFKEFSWSQQTFLNYISTTLEKALGKTTISKTSLYHL